MHGVDGARLNTFLQPTRSPLTDRASAPHWRIAGARPDRILMMVFHCTAAVARAAP